MTHRGWLRRWLGRSRRVRLGVLVLAVVALPAIFAELLAADAPVIAFGVRGVTVLPAVVPPAAYEGRDRSGIAEYHEGDSAIWPVVRCGPVSDCGDGAGVAASWAHPLGTDRAGRDVLARVVYGARHALGLALAALLIASFFGVLLGALAGYVGGFWDEVLARPIELVQAFPAIVVVAVVRAIFPEETAWSLVFAVAAVRWAEVARLVRAEVVRIGAQPYVVAARALGCGHLRVLRRHIFPRAFRPVVVSTMFGVASIVLLEVAVSFLGLGAEGSWGVMLAEGLGAASPRTAIAAGAALAITVTATYLIADATEEALDATVATTSRGF
jgi:peptide/nickel transport system permease protein